ncbi:MAG: hypothetical protein K0R25_894 [Rickettsiaceae bacterium]|jgi:HSP20 family molecular chaperone IbpA|nr:hypothetical protein [Rickettsiaceae bacterium]
MKKIKSLLSHKLLISLLIVSFVASGTTCAIAAKQKAEKESSEAIWKDAFGADIFAEMEAMEKQMNKVFEEQRKLMVKMLKNAEENSRNSSSNSLALYQDEQSYRYELTFNQFKKEDVAVGINNGIMTISAKNEGSGKDKKKGESHIYSNFFYSLSIPSDVVGDPEIKREEGKVTIKFAKKNEQKEGAKNENKAKS